MPTFKLNFNSHYDSKTCKPFEAWWEISPKLISEFLRILGFGRINISYHYQLYLRKKVKLYTVVGRK